MRRVPLAKGAYIEYQAVKKEKAARHPRDADTNRRVGRGRDGTIVILKLYDLRRGTVCSIFHFVLLQPACDILCVKK